MKDRRINIEVSAELHKKIKKMAIDLGISMKELFLKILEDYLKEKK